MRPKAVNMPVTEEQKDEARARILGKLIVTGPVVGTWSEIQEELGLQDISRGLFKRSCWHLAQGDRDLKHRSRITVLCIDYGRFRYGPQSYRIKAV